jgi:ATP phosphoribosyltransferase
MKEYDITGFDISGAQRIGIAKGDDRQPCIEAFEAVTDIEVPSFRDRKLMALSQGREFFLLKGKDIPGLVDGGFVDLGTTGSDSCSEYANTESIRYERIAESMCRLVLMCEEEKREAVEASLDGRHWNMMAVVTSKPKDLNTFASWRDLPLKAVELPPGITLSGSLEVMTQLLGSMGVELVADLVTSGNTARQNNLVEIMTLMNIYPALVQKAQT